MPGTKSGLVLIQRKLAEEAQALNFTIPSTDRETIR